MTGTIGFTLLRSVLPPAVGEDASSDDLFHAVHTVTHWQDQTEHGEKIGLGSREYELIEI